MTNSGRTRVIVWGLAILAAVGATVRIVGWITGPAGDDPLFDAVQALGWGGALPVTFSVLGALIISRQPRNRVGWMVMVIGVALVLPTRELLAATPAPDAPIGPALWLLLWLDNVGWTLVIFPLILLPLFFPTGAAPSPRWSLVARFALVLWSTFTVLAAFTDRMGPSLGPWTTPNPIGFIPAAVQEEPWLFIWGLSLLAIPVASVTSLFVRFRRAGVGERQQIRWLLLAGIAFFVVYVAGFASGDEDVWWVDLLLVLGILGMPLAIANAIFRYRLWDLEVVVNRALIYGLLTTLLAGLFAAVIAVVTEVSQDFVGDGSRTLGAAASALVVAVVFQPLRAWIEGWVNRRFYPEKADLASGMVEVQPEYWGFLDRGALMRIAMDHVRSVMGTSHAAFYLEAEPGTFHLEGRAAGSEGPAATIALSDRSRLDLEKKRVARVVDGGPVSAHVPLYVDRGKATEVLGLLAIGERSNGQGYSGDDLRALAELGGKIGLVLNAIRLGEESRSIRASGAKPSGTSLA